MRAFPLVLLVDVWTGKWAQIKVFLQATDSSRPACCPLMEPGLWRRLSELDGSDSDHCPHLWRERGDNISCAVEWLIPCSAGVASFRPDPGVKNLNFICVLDNFSRNWCSFDPLRALTSVCNCHFNSFHGLFIMNWESSSFCGMKCSELIHHLESVCFSCCTKESHRQKCRYNQVESLFKCIQSTGNEDSKDV